jgi:hypothetical protein
MDNQYKEKFDEFLRNTHNLMFTFEVTKCCGYSTFILIYKEQPLIDIYSTIINHFGNNTKIKQIYFLTSNNERIDIPISKQSISEFLRPFFICSPVKIVPIYNFPNPIIYRLFLDDEHCPSSKIVN